MTRYLFVSLCACIMTFTAWAENGSIEGKVTDARLGPLIFAQVSVRMEGSSVAEMLTDHEGGFIVRDLPQGDYTVTVHRKGESGLTKSVRVLPRVTTPVTFVFDDDGSGGKAIVPGRAAAGNALSLTRIRRSLRTTPG